MAAAVTPVARPDEATPRPSVLVIDEVDGHSRSAVAAVRALAGAGYRPLVAVSGRRSCAAVSRDCAGVVSLPPVGSPDYPGAVGQALAAGPLTALPASDRALVTLGSRGADLVDKAILPGRARAAGFSMPTTIGFDSPEDLVAAAAGLDYPLVVKAAVKSAAEAAAARVDSAAELRSLAGGLLGPVVVQPFQRGAMSAVAGVIHDGALLALVHQAYVRIWPAQCGVASAAVSTAPDLEVESRLPALLDGHNGVFQVQFVGDLLIDVNPRVYGSLPLAVAAGANLPAIACAAAAGHRPGLVRGRPGVRYRWLEGDLRRIVHDLRGGRDWRQAMSALRPRPGTAHSVESLRDPRPGLLRLADVARRLR